MKIVSPFDVTKQLGKHVLNAAWADIKDYNTSLSTLKSDADEIRDSVMKVGKTSAEIFNNLKTNGLKQFSDWFWEKESEFGEFDLEGGDDDFDAGFQIDNGLDEEDDSPSTEILDARSMKDITRGQVGAMYKIGGKQVEAAAMNTSEIISAFNARSSEIVASINNVNKSLGGIQQKLDQLVAVSGYSEEEKRKKREDDIIDYDGRVTVGSAFKSLKKEITDLISPLGIVKDIATSGMVGPSEVIQMTLGEYVKNKNFKFLGDRSIDTIMKSFDDLVGSAIDEGLTRVLDSNALKDIFGTGIGLDLNRGRGVRDFSSLTKNKYTTDVAKFDGITRQTIVEIIPRYLQKITESLTGEHWRINETGYLTTKKVDTFGKVARYATQGSMSDHSFKRVRTKMHDDRITNSQIRDAYKMIVGRYVYEAHVQNLAFVPSSFLEDTDIRQRVLDDVIEALEGYDSSVDWESVCWTTMTQIMDNIVSRRELANTIASNAKNMTNRGVDIANTTTRVQDIRDISWKMIVDQSIGDKTRYKAEQAAYEDFYAKRDKLINTDRFVDKNKVESSIVDKFGNVLKTFRGSEYIEGEIAKYERELEEQLDKISKASYSDDVEEPTTSIIGRFENLQSNFDKIHAVTQNIFELLKDGIIKVQVVQASDYSRRKQVKAVKKSDQFYDDDASEYTSGTRIHVDTQFFASKATNPIAETVDNLSTMISQNKDTNSDGTKKQDTDESSDKNFFDLARTMINAALSNGNGSEDIQSIRAVINKIKDSKLRNEIEKHLKGILDRNSTNQSSDVTTTPEKQSGILGGLFSGLMGSASKIFSPITTLLRPVTGLVKVISKPLIDLAKKGFKAGASDIKAGASQVWQSMRGGRESSGDSGSSDDSGDGDSDGSQNKTHETTEADIKQSESQQMQPLDYNKTQSYTTTATVTQAAPTTNSFTFVPGMNQTTQMPQTEVKGFGTTTEVQPTEDASTATNAKSGGKLAGVMSGLTKMLGGVGKIILTLIMSLSAVKVVIELVKKAITAGIKPLNKAVRRLTKALKPVIKTLSKLIKQVSEFVVNIVDSLMKVLDPLLEILTPVLDAIMVALNPLLSAVLSILDLATTILEPLMPVVDMLLQNASKTLTVVTELINDLIEPLVELITPIAEMIGETLEPFMTEMTGILEPMRDVLETVTLEIFAPQWAAMKNTLIPVVEYISNTLKTLVGVAEIGLGGIITSVGGVVKVLGHLILLGGASVSKVGSQIQESGQNLVTDGLKNVATGVSGMYQASKTFWSNIINPSTEDDGKQTIQTLMSSSEAATQVRAVAGGSILDGISGSGDPMDQHSYGSFLNMSERGCGPVALADVISRRTGSGVNAASLAMSMAGSGAYSTNRGTSIGGFVNTGNALGMDMQVGGVTTNSLRYATPNNPITIIGSGAEYGTRYGNNHYVNVLGTDGSGMAYVSNPLTGNIERHSASALAASSLAGIYGSGDISFSDIFGDAVSDAFDELKSMAGNLLGIFGVESGIGSSIDSIVNDSTTTTAANKATTLLSEAELDKYKKEARAKFEKDHPKLSGESDSAYEKRWAKYADAYLVEVSKDAVAKHELELAQEQSNNVSKFGTSNSNVISSFSNISDTNGNIFESMLSALNGINGNLSSSGGVAQIIPLVIKAYEAAGIIGKSGDYDQSGKTVTLNLNGKQLKERPDCTGLVDSVIDTMGYNSEKMNSASFNTTRGIKDASGNISSDWILSSNPSLSSLQLGDIVIQYGNGVHHGEIVSGVQGNKVYGWNYGSENGMSKSLNAANLQLQGVDPFSATMQANSVLGSNKQYTRVIRYVGTGATATSSYGNQYQLGTGASLANGSTEEQVWYYLTNALGFTKAGAAGVMGNIKAESGMRSNNLEDTYNKKLGMTDEQYTAAVDNGSYSKAQFISDHNKANCGAGYGLPQFTYYTLKQKLYENAKLQNKSIADVGVQFDTIAQTVDSGLLSTLRTTNDIRTASDAWLNKYEKPAERTNNSIRRFNSAKEYYNKYLNWIPTASQLTSSSYTKSVPVNGTVFSTTNKSGNTIYGTSNTNMLYKVTGSGDITDIFGDDTELVNTLMGILMNILSAPYISDEDYELATQIYEWMIQNGYVMSDANTYGADSTSLYSTQITTPDMSSLLFGDTSSYVDYANTYSYFDTGYDTGGYYDDYYTDYSSYSPTTAVSSKSTVTPAVSDLNQAWYDSSTGTYKFRSSATGKVYTRATNASEAAMLAMLGNRGITSSNKSQLSKAMGTNGTYDPSKYNYATNAADAMVSGSKALSNSAKLQYIQDQMNKSAQSRNQAAQRDQHLKYLNEQATNLANAQSAGYISSMSNSKGNWRQYYDTAYQKYSSKYGPGTQAETLAMMEANTKMDSQTSNKQAKQQANEVLLPALKDSAKIGTFVVAPGLLAGETADYAIGKITEGATKLHDWLSGVNEQSNAKSTQTIIADSMNRALQGQESIFTSTGRRYNPGRGLYKPSADMYYNPYATTADEQKTNSAILQYEMSKYKDAKTSTATDAGQAQINAAIKNRITQVEKQGAIKSHLQYLNDQAASRATSWEEAYAAARENEVDKRFYQRLEQQKLNGDQYPSDGMSIAADALKTAAGIVTAASTAQLYPIAYNANVFLEDDLPYYWDTYSDNWNTGMNSVYQDIDRGIYNDAMLMSYKYGSNLQNGSRGRSYISNDGTSTYSKYQRQAQYTQNATDMWQAQANAAIMNREMAKYKTSIVNDVTNASDAQANAAIRNRLAVAKKSGTTTTKSTSTAKKSTVSSIAKTNQKKTQAVYNAVKKSSGSTAKASATAASIAQAQAAKNRKVNKSVLTKKGKGDEAFTISNLSTWNNSDWMNMLNSNQNVGTTINNASNMQIPPIDMSKFNFEDMDTNGTYVNQYYVTPSNSGNEDMLHSILTNTYNVRAERVEELLETIVKKMDDMDKSKPSTSSTSTPNLFPNNDIPAAVNRISQ